VSCQNFGGGLTAARFIKIAAVKVGDLSNTGP
jgi:hypothetical protein